MTLGSSHTRRCAANETIVRCWSLISWAGFKGGKSSLCSAFISKYRVMLRQGKCVRTKVILICFIREQLKQSEGFLVLLALS